MNKTITLKGITDFYNENLQSKKFEYTLANGTVFTVAFYREQLCHLLGLQYVFDNKRYLGESGYQLLADGSVTIRSLKSHNLVQFNFIKERIIYFQKIYDILTQGELVKFYRERVHPYTRIEADFIVYKNGEKRIYHLFLRREMTEKDLYIPISFIVRSYNDKYPRQYLDGQEYKKIEKITII